MPADPAQWAQIEPGFRRQMQGQDGAQTHSARARAVLPEMLPARLAGVQAAAAARLRLSPRSLQRHLGAEGTGFQALLDATRRDLAHHDLTTTDLAIENISDLLAHTDPNSVYRAFQIRVGQTPMAVRRAAGNTRVAS